MINFECIVQEGCVPEDARPRLTAELVRIGASVLGGSPGDVDVEFTEVPRGFGFRGGKPSTTSIVGVRLPDGSEPRKWALMLREIKSGEAALYAACSLGGWLPRAPAWRLTMR